MNEQHCQSVFYFKIAGRRSFADTHYVKSMGLKLDAEDYIDKPIDPKALLARLEKLLKK